VQKLIQKYFVPLFLFSVAAFASALYFGAFVPAKTEAASGQGFSIPFWPFALGLGFLSNPLIMLGVVTIFTAKARAQIAQAADEKNDKSEKP